MRRALSGAAIAAAASVLLSAAEVAPKLIVLIVVDQMRADYVERFHGDWSAGLRRVLDKGAWFTRAAYPYLTTVTCSGHATISTGAYPHVHGVFANTWFDRQRNAVIPCADDQQARVVPYGKAANSRTGPSNLLVPSLADLLRGKGGHVVTLALKARSAIMLAGHGGDAATWISESLDGWETSTAFAQAPVPHVKAFVSANPLEADYGKVWNRSLPESRYRDVDNGLAEDPPHGWTSNFPHTLKGESANGEPGADYYVQWQHSPFADAYVARMAGALVESMQLGLHEGTDFLGVSFSSPDLVGHGFGPRSQEVQDVYANLDRSLGGLLDQLDKVVGPDHYVLALSADHGVTDIPEQAKKAGRDAGRVNASALLNAAESNAQHQLGPGKYVSRLNGNDIYFEPGEYDKAVQKGAVKAIVNAVVKQPGIARVFTAVELAGGAQSSDVQLRAAALSYVPHRSGDLVVSLKPGWMLSAGGTTHGSATADDQRVPVVFFGRVIKPGKYASAVSPADVAPTLAKIAGITLPDAEGHALTEALR